MYRRFSQQPALLALPILLCAHLASAATEWPDTVVQLAPQPAVRAGAVSDPIPIGGRVLFNPVGGGPGEQFGNSVASAGDVNGDGYPDLIVGAWASDGNAGDAGAAYVYFGGPSADQIADWIVRGEGLSDNLGTSVAAAGDVNGDGFGDIIVGAWRSPNGSTQTGRAYVYFGGVSPNSLPDLVLSGQAFADRFGISVSSAGDINADGFGDVIVGAYLNDGGGGGAGRAYIYFGGAVPDPVADMTLTGAADGDNFGYSVALAGDANGDGYPDVVIGAPESGGTGRAYLFFGGPGMDALVDRTFTGSHPGDHFGISAASAGDVNGDGSVDLIVGAHGDDTVGIDAGSAYVYYGGPTGDTSSDLTLLGEHFGDHFGVSVAGGGDMNGDGFGDAIVGAWQSGANGVNAGRAYVYFGGSADVSPDLVLTGEAPEDRFGNSVAGLGDLNADGGRDLVVGAYFNDAAAPDAGRAYVITLDLNRPPLVTAPATVTASVGVLVQFTVTASDPDGEPITSLVAAPLPTGAAFSTNPPHTSGTFAWTPSAADAGSDHDVTFTAANNLTGSAMTRISLNRLPTLDPIANMTVEEGLTADQALHGSDPDGDPLAFALASGPGFATVTTTGATSGNLHIAPGFGSTGTYAATVRASDGRGGTAQASITITVTRGNRAPVLSGPAGIFGSEGASISVTIMATDADGDRVTLGAFNRPVGSLFIDLGNNSGSFNWTPGFGQAGDYAVTFTGRDALGATATPLALTITIDNVNRGPTASAGGPYSGVVNVPITFNGTASSDPDGSLLSYTWDFGDLTTGSGITPVHSYAAGGTFPVSLTVDDGALADDASTIATIQSVFPARAFTAGGNRTIRLGSGKASWCTQIEPVNDDFLATAVVATTVRMKYGAGQILAENGKLTIGGDKDANGVQEMTACFSKTDLRTLFGGLPKGTNTISVTLEGDLITGGTFRGTLTVDVVKSGGQLAASLTPNPLNPSGVLTFVTSQPGVVRVSVFDLRGRLIRTLEPGTHMNTGYHDVSIDGRNDRGEMLSSGAYFYRIEAKEAVETGRFMILK